VFENKVMRKVVDFNIEREAWRKMNNEKRNKENRENGNYNN
jgi:hypothetical protein